MIVHVVMAGMDYEPHDLIGIYTTPRRVTNAVGRVEESGYYPRGCAYSFPVTVNKDLKEYWNMPEVVPIPTKED